MFPTLNLPHLLLTITTLLLLHLQPTTAAIDPPSFIFRLLAASTTNSLFPPSTPGYFLEISPNGVGVLNFTSGYKGFDTTNAPLTILPGRPSPATRGGVWSTSDSELEWAELVSAAYLLPMNTIGATGMYQLAFGKVPSIPGVLSSNFTTDRRSARCPVGQETCPQDLWYDLEGAAVPGKWFATPLGEGTWSVQWAQPTLNSKNIKAGVPPVGSVELVLFAMRPEVIPGDGDGGDGGDGGDDGDEDGGDEGGVPSIPVIPEIPGQPAGKGAEGLWRRTMRRSRRRRGGA